MSGRAIRLQVWGWLAYLPRDPWPWVKASARLSLADSGPVLHGFDEPRLPYLLHAPCTHVCASILAADDTRRNLSVRNAAGIRAISIVWRAVKEHSLSERRLCMSTSTTFGWR
jgi:hypothetical protein